MRQLVEFNVRKYKHGTSPQDGIIIYSRLFYREDYEVRRAALSRLLKMLESRDEDLYFTYPSAVMLKKVCVGAAFNDMGKVIYERKLRHTGNELKALRRLAKFCEKRDPENLYFGSYKNSFEGTCVYQSSIRFLDMLNDKDKENVRKRLMSGRKAAITKAINKAKTIRAEYAKTLFPEEYKSDPVFLRHLKTLPAKRKRYFEIKNTSPENIPTLPDEFDKEAMKYIDVRCDDR